MPSKYISIICFKHMCPMCDKGYCVPSGGQLFDAYRLQTYIQVANYGWFTQNVLPGGSWILGWIRVRLWLVCKFQSVWFICLLSPKRVSEWTMDPSRCLKPKTYSLYTAMSELMWATNKTKQSRYTSRVMVTRGLIICVAWDTWFWALMFCGCPCSLRRRRRALQLEWKILVFW